MGRPGEGAFLLVLVVLLGTLQGIGAQYDVYNDYDFDEDDFNDGEHMVEDEEEAVDDEEPRPINSSCEEGGIPPLAGPHNKQFTPMCNNENCWIRVDWEPPPRDTWMSCLLGYRVGFRKYEEYEQQDWTWMNDEGTYRDLRSDKLFFFEEAERTNHSLTIRNLDFETDYEVKVEVFNPYGTYYPTTRSIERTPPG